MIGTIDIQPGRFSPGPKWPTLTRPVTRFLGAEPRIWVSRADYMVTIDHQIMIP